MTHCFWMPVKYVLDWDAEKRRWFLDVIAWDGAPAVTGMMFTREMRTEEEKEELRKAVAAGPAAEDWHVLTAAEDRTWTGIVPLAEGHPVIMHPGLGTVEWTREQDGLRPHDVEFWDTRKTAPGIAGNGITKWYGRMSQAGSPEFPGFGSSCC